MKKDELKALGLTDEQIDAVWELNGKDIKREQDKAVPIVDARDALTRERDAIKQQLDEANGKLAQFQSVDVEGLKTSLADITGKYATLEKDHKTKVADLEMDALLREKLAGLSFSSEYARLGVYNDIKDKGITVTDGKLSGYDEAIKAIKEAQPSAFLSVDSPKSDSSAPVTVDLGAQHTDGTSATSATFTPNKLM